MIYNLSGGFATGGYQLRKYMHIMVKLTEESLYLIFEYECFDWKKIESFGFLIKGQTVIQDHFVRKVLKFIELYRSGWGY